MTKKTLHCYVLPTFRLMARTVIQIHIIFEKVEEKEVISQIFFHYKN